jgi:hypothetical protein
MAITSGQVIVGTTPVELSSSNVSDYRIHIHNNDNQANLYLGGSDVTINNGLVLQKLDSTEIALSPSDSIWAVSSSTNHLVSYLKVT